MTETKHDPCRVMAEKMFDQLDAVPVGDETPELLATIIRNHTVVPEIVEVLRGAQSALYGSKIDKANCLWKIERLLTKAEGRKS